MIMPYLFVAMFTLTLYTASFFYYNPKPPTNCDDDGLTVFVFFIIIVGSMLWPVSLPIIIGFHLAEFCRLKESNNDQEYEDDNNDEESVVMCDP